MREIKFRAWNKHDKEMSFVVNVYSEINGESWWSADVVGIETGDTVYSFDEDNGFIMQYTGLKDKNGVEIYEGDIVSDGKINSVVIWRERSYWLEYINTVKTSDPGSEGCPFFWQDRYEVIGNIHENPLDNDN